MVTQGPSMGIRQNNSNVFIDVNVIHARPSNPGIISTLKRANARARVSRRHRVAISAQEGQSPRPMFNILDEEKDTTKAKASTAWKDFIESLTKDASEDGSAVSKAAMFLPKTISRMLDEMADLPKFSQRGGVWVFAQSVAFLFIFFPFSVFEDLARGSGALVILAAAFVMVRGFDDLGKNLTPLPTPREGSTLVTTGIYGKVRHPLYGGVLMGFIGVSIMLGLEERLIPLAFLWWVLEQKVEIEEKNLREMFGESYNQYMKDVPKKFIPFTL